MSFVTQFVWDPPAAENARRYNLEARETCDHGRDPCVTFCGVTRATDGGLPPTAREGRAAWTPLTPECRSQFFGRMVGLWFLRNEEDLARGLEVFLGLPGEPLPFEKHAEWMATWPKDCACGAQRVRCEYHALDRGPQRSAR